MSPTAWTAAGAAPRLRTRGPVATSRSSLPQCQTPAALRFQKPAMPGRVWRSPSRVRAVARCHQADPSRHLKSAFLPDFHGHHCLGHQDKRPNWLPARGLFSLPSDCAPLPRLQSHDLVTPEPPVAPWPPRLSQPGLGPEGPALSSSPCPPSPPHCRYFQVCMRANRRNTLDSK